MIRHAWPPQDPNIAAKLFAVSDDIVRQPSLYRFPANRAGGGRQPLPRLG
jgi:hypothetical protein